MSEINIAGAIDELMIFDDPEYCGAGILRGDELCFYLRHGHCMLFPAKKKKNLFDPLSDFQDLRVVKKGERVKKCNQCKDAYRKAVNEKLFDEEKQYTPDGP